MGSQFSNDAFKKKILQDSLLNIGRLLPEGMSVTFVHAPGAMTTVEQTFPNGEVVRATFTSHSPIVSVPVVPEEYRLESYEL